MKSALHFLSLLLFLLFPSCEKEIAQWRGPARDGIYQDKNLLKEWPEDGPALALKIEDVGKGLSQPVVYKNKIYITGIKHDTLDVISVFDMAGKLLWEKEFSTAWPRTYPESRGTPTIENGRIYLIGGSGELVCLSTKNGDLIWKQDKSDGNPDSTAIGSWVSFDETTPNYTNEVYLIGTYDGIAYNLAKKVQFISVNDKAYTFLIGDPDTIGPDTIEVIKDNRINYIQFSLEDNSTLQLEPEKEEWDILFSQYFTILYTDDSIRAPYYVRGVLLNPNLVEAALDTTINFLDVNYSNASLNTFSSSQDIIGHDWKSVTVDEASNSAEYKVRPGYTYIVRDANNVLYKFRFKSYFNKSGIKGYPSIEFARLNTE